MGNKISSVTNNDNYSKRKTSKKSQKKFAESDSPENCSKNSPSSQTHGTPTSLENSSCQTSPSLLPAQKQNGISQTGATALQPNDNEEHSPQHKPPKYPANDIQKDSTNNSGSGGHLTNNQHSKNARKPNLLTTQNNCKMSKNITNFLNKKTTFKNMADGDNRPVKLPQFDVSSIDDGIFHKKYIYVPQDEKSMMLFITNRGQIIKDIMQKTYTTIKLSSVAISCTGKERLKLGTSQKREILIEGYHRSDVQKALRCIAEYLSVIDANI